MHAITFDTFKFISRLREAGIPEGQAAAISEAIKETQIAQFEDLAARRDLKDLEGQLATKADVTRMDLHVLELKRDIEANRVELKRDIRELEYRMTIRVGLMLVTALGMLFTALRYFPPTQPIVISSAAFEQNMGKSPVSVQPAIPHPAP
ncbi:MAG: hypothetical protein HQL87_03975 [Magnetococcales bacterium]|nr:hypothetical protein [Magnetococcales bacterium]